MERHLCHWTGRPTPVEKSVLPKALLKFHSRFLLKWKSIFRWELRGASNSQNHLKKKQKVGGLSFLTLKLSMKGPETQWHSTSIGHRPAEPTSLTRTKGKRDLSAHGARKTGRPHAKGRGRALNIRHTQKQKWTKDLNLRANTITFLEKKIGEKFHDNGLANNFINVTPKAQSKERKNKEIGFHPN